MQRDRVSQDPLLGEKRRPVSTITDSQRFKWTCQLLLSGTSPVDIPITGLDAAVEMKMESMMTTEGGTTIAPNRKVEFDVATAQLWINDIVKKFETLDLDTMTACFTEDVEINYVGHDQMIGKAALHKFLQSRYAVMRNYSLKKVVRCVTGNVVGIDASVSYDDIATGRRMFGRAFEFLTVRDGKVSRWDNISVYVS